MLDAMKKNTTIKTGNKAVTYHLRNIPGQLHTALRAKAERECTSIRQVIIDACRKAVSK
jgi:hypothetical protein